MFDKKVMDALDKFIDDHDTYHSGKSFSHKKLTYRKGKKYVKISRDGIVFGFMTDDGNLWKPAGASAPALNFPRSNVFKYKASDIAYFEFVVS